MTIVPKVEKRVRRQIHISGINMLNECGQRFFYRYVLGIKHAPNAFLLVGTSTHKTIDKDLGHKIETGELLSASDVKEFAAATFEAEQKNYPVELDVEEKAEGKSLDAVLGEAKDKTVSLTTLHHSEAAPIIQATALSKKFSVNMDAFLRKKAKEFHALSDQSEDRYNRKILESQAVALNAMARDGVDFCGEWDIVESGDLYTIRDTKTSGKSPSIPSPEQRKSGKTSVADDSDQLTGYAVAAHVEEGKLPDKMVLDYLVCTPTKKETKYVPVSTTRDLDDVGVFLNRFINAVHAIKTGVFVPTKPDDWRCSQKWCGFFDICIYAKRPKLIQIGDTNVSQQ